jgi:hypothetical protein
VLSRIFGEQRLDFTRKSIVYLFRTTYTSADSLTIAALVAYMNAALPPDKHEEFDTAEVTRAAKMLHDRGSVAFEGDMLKPLHWNATIVVGFPASFPDPAPQTLLWSSLFYFIIISPSPSPTLHRSLLALLFFII